MIDRLASGQPETIVTMIRGMEVRVVLAAIAIGGAVTGITACSTTQGQPGGVSPPVAAPSTIWTTVDPPQTDTPTVPTEDTSTVSPEDLDASTYETLSPRDFALLVKDPDSNKGRKVMISGVVTQFDAATGPSDFRARTGADPADVSVNAVVSAPDPTILANVVKGDHVTMWCKVQGTVTYDNVMGGKITVPVFTDYIIKEK
jgi:hypothetical protein